MSYTYFYLSAVLNRKTTLKSLNIHCEISDCHSDMASYRLTNVFHPLKNYGAPVFRYTLNMEAEFPPKF